MKAIKCPNCGAPVEMEEDSALAACGFCGASLAPTATLERPRVSVVRIDARGVSRQVGRGLAWALFVFFLIAGIGAFVAFRAISIGRQVSRNLSRPPTRGTTVPVDRDRPLALEELAKLDRSGRYPVAAAPPPGGFAAVDPASWLPFALAIAQRWAPDARPMRIDVERLHPDGTADVANDAQAEVMWRFQSPARLAAFRERANLESDPEGRFEFWVIAKQGRVWVQSIETLSALLRMVESPPPYPDVPPLAETMRAAGRSSALPRVPFYNAYLIHLEDEGWCWYLATLSGAPDIPRLRPRDGRFYPYRG